MIDIIGMLQLIKNDINALVLQGSYNWNHAASAIQKIDAIITEENAKKEHKKIQEDKLLEEKRKQREKQLKEAAERGEEIVGGETVRLYPDGTQEVLIP